MSVTETRPDLPSLRRFLDSTTPKDRAEAIRELFGEEAYERVLELRRRRELPDTSGLAGDR